MVQQLLNLCRVTVYRKRDHWICSGYGDILSSTSASFKSLQDYLQSLQPNEQWCIANSLVEDGCRIIAEAIRNRVAIAVSDGSFKDAYGTAIWVLEGDTSNGRIIGCVIAPGNSSNHLAYRSELSGILAVTVMVTHLCSYFSITKGSVELACDGLSAIDKAFSYVSLLYID